MADKEVKGNIPFLTGQILNPEQLGGSEGEQMKKYLALVLGVIFTLGFAASAFAIHAEIPAETQAVVAKGSTQVTLGGELRFRGEYRHANDLNSNSTPAASTDNAANDSISSYDGRVRIRIQADVSKNTMGVIHLETGSGTTDAYTWGTSGETAGVYRGVGNGKKALLMFLKPGFSTSLTSAFLPD